MKNRLAPLALVAAGILALTGCGDPEAEARESASQQAEMRAALEASAPRTVLVEVEPVRTYDFYERLGDKPTATVSVNTSEGTEQADVNLPMIDNQADPGATYSLARGEVLSMSAQIEEGAAGILCRISVDGTVLVEKTSTGRYSVVSCAATIE
ncbi:hypothetical protein ABDK96_01865 [Citricoccus nitrophenolicus]|uniref:MmpS family membrane protein n=1 Tax=Citricoccus nitrophenolicus TaxID=863575 RepID=A0ABV0IE30_9MICC